VDAPLVDQWQPHTLELKAGQFRPGEEATLPIRELFQSRKNLQTQNGLIVRCRFHYFNLQ
jgi:hypothetical protein